MIKLIPESRWKYSRLSYIVLLVCWVIYAALTLMMPAHQPNPYHMTHPEQLLLQLSIILPIGLIWYISLRGALTFKGYAESIEGSPEAPGLSQVATGLLWAVAYLVVIALSGAALPYFASTSMYHGLIVAHDHIHPLVGLVAFVFLYRGSQSLVHRAGAVTWTRSTFVFTAVFAVLAALFVFEFAQGSPDPAAATSLTVMPRRLLLFTLVIPYLATWFLGLIAATNITKYAGHVKGSIYRRALQYLVMGILAIIGFAVLLQMLTFAARYLSGMSLGSILLILYGLVALYGLGFLFVRAGAKMLARIEAAQ